jgi:hypothetical protein
MRKPALAGVYDATGVPALGRLCVHSKGKSGDAGVEKLGTHELFDILGARALPG